MKQLLVYWLLAVAVPGFVRGEFVICDEPGSQREPAIGFDGTRYVVVWSDESGTLSKLYGARVTETGVVIDTGGRILAEENDNQRYAAVGFDGTNFLITWQFGC